MGGLLFIFDGELILFIFDGELILLSELFIPKFFINCWLLMIKDFSLTLAKREVFYFKIISGFKPILLDFWDWHSYLTLFICYYIDLFTLFIASLRLFYLDGETVLEWKILDYDVLFMILCKYYNVFVPFFLKMQNLSI